MSLTRIAKFGTKAVYGISERLARKPYTSLTASQYCKVAKGAAKGNPIVKEIIDEFFKSGKHFEKWNNDMVKWAKSTNKEFGLPVPQVSKIFRKGKLTQSGKKLFQDELTKRGLPKNSTVKDLLNYDALNSFGNGGFGCFA